MEVKTRLQISTFTQKSARNSPTPLLQPASKLDSTTFEPICSFQKKSNFFFPARQLALGKQKNLFFPKKTTRTFSAREFILSQDELVPQYGLVSPCSITGPKILVLENPKSAVGKEGATAPPLNPLPPGCGLFLAAAGFEPRTDPERTPKGSRTALE